MDTGRRLIKMRLRSLLRHFYIETVGRIKTGQKKSAGLDSYQFVGYDIRLIHLKGNN